MKFASITVTYFPDAPILSRQLDAIPPGWLRVIVDNGTPASLWKSVESSLSGRGDVVVLKLPVNRGLAAAQNEGIRWLSARQIETHILLLDQDSEPCDGAVHLLLQALESLTADGVPVAAVGPLLVDAVAGAHHGFHVINGWRWSRVNPIPGKLIRCASLNGSGTLMSLATAIEHGGMDEKLFIDLIDADWSFRLGDQGLELYGVSDSVFRHRMGERTTRIWLFGWRTWPSRSPRRHRFLFRNGMILLKKSHVPVVWKLWAIPKFILTAGVFAVTGPQRLAQLRAMTRGVFDGLLGRTGDIS